MKSARILGYALLLVVFAGSARASSQAPLTRADLATILGQPAVAGSCATQQDRVLLTAKPPVSQPLSLCTATAHCATGTVSCSSNSSTTACSAADRDCSIGERGHVTCDGVTTVCPTVCSFCDECNLTGDCFACCRCGGGRGPACTLQCNGSQQ